MNQYLITYLLMGILASLSAAAFFQMPDATFKSRIAFFFFVWAFYPVVIAYWVWDGITGFRIRIRCAWCGAKVDTNNPEEIQEHVRVCKKHPLLTRIAQLEAKNNVLQAKSAYDVSIRVVDNLEETKLKNLIESCGFKIYPEIYPKDGVIGLKGHGHIYLPERKYEKITKKEENKN